ncbi:MAG TPA: DUF3108 domain-containing protein [Vicinamibacterales bacterium]|nr:DUF3108 domain-containing protein [Vicinamibacterales bacterium]
MLASVWGGVRLWLLRLCGYTLAAAALTWPLLPQVASHLGAPYGPGDPYFQLWVLGWNLHALTTDPTALLNGRIFNANIFFPAPGTLAYSDHQLLQALAVLPAYWAAGDVAVCYNVLLLASFIASGLAMHVYARSVSGSEAGAWVAGLAWSFFPYRFSHLIHIQLQALYFLPIALLFLHRLVAGRRWRDAVLLGLFAGLQAVAVWNYGVVTMIALAVGGAALAIGVGRWRSRALVARAAVAALVGTIVVAPFAIPYWRAQQREGFARSLYDASRHAARPLSYLQVNPENRLYGRTGLLTARDESGRVRPGRTDGVEHALFPGVTLVVLACAGLSRGRRAANRPVVWTMLALVVAGGVFSLGPDGVRWLYAAAHQHVFGFQSLRAPARFAVLVVAALAVLASLFVASVPPGRRRILAAAGAAALLLAEYASVPLTYAVRPARQTDVGQWLARAQGPGAVVHLPLTHDERNTLAMVQSLEHWRPVVNGYSGQRPPFFTALVDALSGFPSAEALWALRDFDVRFVVSPSPVPGVPHPDTGEPLPIGETPLVERARYAEGVIYELVWTAEHSTRLPRPAPPAPPPPGTPPFAIGERATYEVRWLGAGLGMPAGRATIEVRRGEQGPYRFVATAETAAWVQRFFDARNVYATEASSDLLPARQTRDEQQGHRHVRRAFTFDHDARVVRISGAEDAEPIALPMPPGTRDALTALYYLRSRALSPGDTIRVPVNDGGRNLVLDVRAEEEELIDVGGQAVRALRLTPRIVQRVQRRQPIELVVWLSRDERRIPLRADVSAGFGRLRVDLVSWESR